MREPGAPRRNPLFEAGEGHGRDPSADPDPAGGAAADPSGADGRPASPGIDSAVTDLARALQGAQPEAAEHLVAAAHELVLAVKTVVDAAESSLEAQRAALAAAAAAARPPADGSRDDPAGPSRAGTEPEARPAPVAPVRRSRVRPIDLA